jgi:hypothetical protein
LQEYNPGYELGEKIYVSIRSSVLNEDRTAEVIVPGEFKADSKDQYDVIYILEGIRAHHYVAYDYLRGEGFIPKRTTFVGLRGLKDTPTRYTSILRHVSGEPALLTPCRHLSAR